MVICACGFGVGGLRWSVVGCAFGFGVGGLGLVDWGWWIGVGWSRVVLEGLGLVVG